MARIRHDKTSFTAGAIDPRAAGRVDLKAYENGAAVLRNVIVEPMGGIVRRPGLAYIDTLPGRARLIGFEFSTVQQYLIALCHEQMLVYRDAVRQAVSLTSVGADPVAVGQAVGTNIGNATADLAAAFDDGNSETASTSARKQGAYLAVGKTYSPARRIAKVQVWPPTDTGYVDSYTGDIVFELRASQTLPADWRADGVEIGSKTLPDTTAGWQTVFSDDQDTAWAHVWLVIRRADGGTDRTNHCAEARFFEPAAPVGTPWTEAQLTDLDWTQSADTLLVVHPDVRPQKITRTGHTTWQIGPWTFHEAAGRIGQPHHKFAAAAVTLTPSATTGTITLTASADVFEAGHAGLRFRLGDKEVELSTITSPLVATAEVKETLANTNATTDWTEAAWSAVHGWPASVCFHQGRLVAGGSRDLPNSLWLSKSADLFNFEFGESEADDAIEEAILDDQVNAVRAVFSGRHLQVYTTGAEFMVTGEPLSPTDIAIRRQTRLGSPLDRRPPPVSIDGATVFVGRRSGGVHEFLFQDVEQAYTAPDLSLLSQHLVGLPVDQAYDQRRRLLHVVRSDGGLITATIYRQEQVTAWTEQVTDGAFRAVAIADDETWFVVERAGAFLLERFDDGMSSDSAIAGESVTAKTDWSGADHLAGRTCRVVADGTDAGSIAVGTGGSIAIASPAFAVTIGLPFEHEIVPLAPGLLGLPDQEPARRVRLVKLVARLDRTASLAIDVGMGLTDVPLRSFGAGLLDAPLPPYTGDVTITGIGWTNGQKPLWRIADATPMPFRLLMIRTEMMAND